MDEASLMIKEAMDLDDLEVEITPTAVNNKPSTSHTLQTLVKYVQYWVRLILRDHKIDNDAKVKT